MLQTMLLYQKRNQQKNKNGGSAYTKEELNNIDLQINGLTDEIKAYLTDSDKLETEIKEYIYLNGLIDTTVANITNWNMENSDTMKMQITLNDGKTTVLNVSINLKENEYQITKEEKQ